MQIKFCNILNGRKEFRNLNKGKLVLQSMFVKENKDFAKDLARTAKDVRIKEVQFNTPLRPCNVKPFSNIIHGYNI